MANQFGMIGLGVMGQNLALNVADHGFGVSVWNRESERADKFAKEHASGRTLTAHRELKDFVQSLERPRRMMMLIKAGKPVDEMIDKLLPLLEADDIIIDGGNSEYQDTERREAAVRAKGMRFIGCGVSGGEEGARHGPSLMPGGEKKAYESMRAIFEAIAAKTDSGPCVTHIGAGGSGHYVKMVHNGIEYADMQIIAEAYDLLRRVGGLGAGDLGEVFAEWNEGPLSSFLVEITADIFTVNDEKTGKPLVDMVLDKAGQKGTGRWTVEAALEYGVSVPSIAAAIDARVLSSMKGERQKASKILRGPASEGKLDRAARERLIGEVHDAFYAARICTYAQGMGLIAAGDQAHKWGVDLREIARIWKGGCIIRAKLLDVIMQAYARKDQINLMLADPFPETLEALQPSWRRVVAVATTAGIPIPVTGATLAYYDSYRTDELPQNLTQAQRDYFGAHTYVRADEPDKGPVHTDWRSLAAAVEQE